MNPKVNVLHICGSFKRGGITSFVRSILELNPVTANRHDLVVLFENEKINIPGTDVYCLGKYIGNPFRVFSRIRKIIKNYSLIMLHKAHPLVVFPLLFMRKRVLIFQHGMAVSRGFFLKRLIKKMWYSMVPALLHGKVICSTEFAYGKTRKSGIRFSRRRVEIIPFGININRRTRPLYNREKLKKELLVGSAGIMSKIKRFDLLIKSLTNYTGKLNIHLRIAGEGPEKEFLSGLAARLTNKNVTVEFPGHVKDITAFYDSLDLFVFPSHNESFGLVVLEALSRGVPVALFPDVGGALPLIENNGNGFVLNDGVGGLEELWLKLNKDPLILMDMVKYINKMDLSAYDIKATRRKLETLSDDSVWR